jgi:hypothetical protein
MSEEQDDTVFRAYSEWLNDALFAASIGAHETLVWLEDGRWVLLAPEGPDVWLIELHRAEVKAL